MTILELLSKHGIRFDQRESENVYVECPKCTKDKFSINVFTGTWHCWNADCEEAGYKGPPGLLFQELGIPDEGISLTFEVPPERDRSLSDVDAKAILHAASNKVDVIEWAGTRSLDPTFVLSQGVGYDSSKRAIVFPFRDEKGNLIGARYRGTNGDFWCVGQEPLLYILDPADLSKEKVVIVEGEVDALTLKQFGIPVVATLGAGKDKGFGLLGKVRQLLLGYDMDSAGEVGVEKAASALGRYRCKRPHWSYQGRDVKDPNDMLKLGAERGDFIECLLRARTLITEVKSKSARDALNDYLTALSKAPRKRFSWGFPRLDSFTAGIGGGMYVGVLAEAGTGKTTFMINVARNLAHQGVNVGICSLEEHAINEITPKVAATVVGRNPGSGSFSQEEVEAASPILTRIHLYEGDEEVDAIIDWIKECYYVHDVKFIFIDYLQWLVPDEKDTELMKRIGKTFKKLVKDMPELCVVMIIQPGKLPEVLKQDGTKVKKKLHGTDARGGSTINQSVDVMLTIRVVEGHPNITQFEYTKVRGHLRVSKKDWLNQFTQLEYDHATLRQVELNHMIYGN